MSTGPYEFNFLINSYVFEDMIKLCYNELTINEFIYNLLNSPSCNIIDFEIDENDISLFIKKFVKENQEYFENFDFDSENILDEFIKKINIYIGDYESKYSIPINYPKELISTTMDNISSMSKNVINNMPQINIPIGVFNNINNAHVSVASMLRQHKVYESYIDNTIKTIESMSCLNESIYSHIKCVENMKYTAELLNNQLVAPINFINSNINQSVINSIYLSLNNIPWDELNRSIKVVMDYVNSYNYLEYYNKHRFSISLQGFIDEIEDNGELKHIFNNNFLNELVDNGNWWIMPILTKEDFKFLSEKNFNSKEIDSYILGRYIEHPELIADMIESWNVDDGLREKIILQAYENYLIGNYETAVILLTLQIEGIIRDKMDINAKKLSKFRIKLEKQLKDISFQNPWDDFLNKANNCFIWMILKPLYDSVDFNQDKDEINRNIMTHCGVVNADNIVAIRMFILLDTLFYIFNNVLS